MGANGGKVPYGGLDNIVKTYNQNGFKAVTRQNLYYRLRNLKAGKNDSETNLLGQTIAVSGASQGVISDITEEHILADVSNTEQSIQPNPGGRKKGSTKKAKKEKVILEKNLVTRCTILYQNKLDEAKRSGLPNVPSGTLKKIINEEGEKAGLSVNTISIDAIRSRIKRGNLAGFNENLLSPIHSID